MTQSKTKLQEVPVAHPNLKNRALITAGAAMLLTASMAAPAVALAGDISQATEAALPEPVAEAAAPALEPVVEAVKPVEEALAPVAEAVEPVADAVESVVAEAEAALEPVKEALPAPLAEVVDKASATAPGGDSSEPGQSVPTPVAPASPATSPAGPQSASPAPVTASPLPESGSQTATPVATRSRSFAVTPSVSPPGMQLPLLSDAFLSSENPAAAGPQAAAATPLSGSPLGPDTPAWLLATATGLLLLVGSGHVLQASGRLAHLQARH